MQAGTVRDLGAGRHLVNLPFGDREGWDWLSVSGPAARQAKS
jgi:hypothetical protein